jgi:tetratricopeptide (TPR) repeat protein
MSRQPVSVGGRGDVAEVRHELLGRLGLRENASDQDVETVHNGVVEFLELAPHEVKSWAAAQTADVDEAFALLSGPEQDLVPQAAQTPVSLDKGSLPSDESGQSDETRQPPPAPYVAPAAPTTAKPRRTQMLGAGVILLVVAVVFGVWYMGRDQLPGISGAPTNTQATTAASGAPAATPLDQVKVAALMKKISANPKDVASLQSLGDLYFASQDYKNASVWEQKILAVDPKSQVALLALGAAQFNLGNSAAAKKQWLVASALYPKSAEVHYDLGFLYMSQTPPDKVNMNIEWKKVIAIDPNSNLAKTVATHISGTKPTASATPSAK